MSKVVIDLQKAANSVVEAGKEHVLRVTERLDERFGDTPEPRPDFQTLQLGFVALVEDGLQELLSFDETHVSELSEDRALIEERDAAAAELAGRIGEVKSVWEGVYGASACSQVCGGVTELPYDPLVLHRLGQRIYRNLTREDLVLPPPQPGWPAIDRVALAEAFAAVVTRLGDALARLNRERKATDGSLHDKSVTIEGFARTVRFAAGCLASLYGLAGLDDLAAKIRPKRRATPQPSGDPSPGEGETTPAGIAGAPPANDNPAAPPQLLPGSFVALDARRAVAN